MVTHRNRVYEQFISDIASYDSVTDDIAKKIHLDVICSTILDANPVEGYQLLRLFWAYCFNLTNRYVYTSQYALQLQMAHGPYSKDTIVPLLRLLERSLVPGSDAPTLTYDEQQDIRFHAGVNAFFADFGLSELYQLREHGAAYVACVNGDVTDKVASENSETAIILRTLDVQCAITYVEDPKVIFSAMSGTLPFPKTIVHTSIRSSGSKLTIKGLDITPVQELLKLTQGVWSKISNTEFTLHDLSFGLSVELTVMRSADDVHPRLVALNIVPFATA